MENDVTGTIVVVGLILARLAIGSLVAVWLVRRWDLHWSFQFAGLFFGPLWTAVVLAIVAGCTRRDRQRRRLEREYRADLQRERTNPRPMFVDADGRVLNGFEVGR